MKEKLRSSRGMTLTELLVALAVVSLIGVAMTVGISSAVKVYRDATRLYEAETLCGTVLTYLEDEFRFGRNVHESGGDVVFDSQSFGNDVKVSLTDDGKILVAKDASAAGSGSRLLADEAYTSGLRVGKCEIIYLLPDAAAGRSRDQVQITVAVGPANGETYVEHMVKVAPVNN